VRTILNYEKYNILIAKTMPFKYLLIATFGALLFINYSGTAATAATDLSQKKAEFLPLASFLYAKRNPMRVG